MESKSAIGPELMHKYAWDYFQVHANQRMSIFNFFIALSVLMTGALIGTFHKDFTMPLLGIGLGIGLMFIAFIFWKLDQRTKYLIKNAERALAEIELQFPTASATSQPHVTQLVRWEAHETEKVRSKHWRWAPWAQFSYAQSFNLVFLLFGAAGVIGTVLSIVRYYRLG